MCVYIYIYICVCVCVCVTGSNLKEESEKRFIVHTTFNNPNLYANMLEKFLLRSFEKIRYTFMKKLMSNHIISYHIR